MAVRFPALFSMAAIAIVVKRAPWMAVTPFAFASIMGLIFLPVSLAVRQAMRQVEASVPVTDDAGHAEEFRTNGLIVLNFLRAPGVVVVRDDKLVLARMLGKTVELQLASVSKATEKSWFNGNLMMGGARGSWLQSLGYSRLGVAVQDSAALRTVLERHGGVRVTPGSATPRPT